MAGEQSRVVDAFIDIKARKAFANEEMRRLGHEAGREFERGYEAEVDKGVTAGKAKRAAQGKQVGADIGDPAGKEAGTRTSAGISDSLARSRGRRRKDGDDLGAVLGAAAGARAGRSTTEGISKRLAASYGSFEKDGARLGDVLGAAMGDHAAGLTRKAIRRELDAEAKIRARESALEVRAANAALRAQVKAAGAASRLAARAARERAAAIRVEERATAKATAAAEKAQVARLGRLKKLVAGLSAGTGKGILAAGGIGAIASSASSLGGVLAGTVGAVAQLSGALALLPAIGVAAGTGLAAVKIGVHDVGDALSNSGDPEKYAESLKKLSPAARLFTKAVVALKPELKALRNEVQEGLFKGLDKQVTALGDRYLPILSRGLTGVAKGFNGGAVAVGKFLDSSKASQQVAGILDNTSRASVNLGKAFKPVVAGLLDLTSVGAGFLPKLTENIGKSATRLAKFLATAHRSGELRSFIQGGIDGFKQLGRIVGNTGRILGGLFKAGATGPSSALATLADLLGTVADQIGRPEFQAGLGNFFASIKSAGASVGDALPKVADALIALEPAISKIVSGSGTALASILKTVSGAATTLAPTLNFLAGVFQSIAPHAGALVIALVAVKGALLALKTASGVVDALATIRGRIDNVGGAADKARTKVGKFGGAVGLASKATATFGGVLIGQAVFSQFTDGADASVVKVGALTAALKKLQSGQDAGSVGILGDNFEKLGKQLSEAADPSKTRSFVDGLGKVQSKLTGLLTGGKSDGSGKGGFFSIDTGVSSAGGKQATELAKNLKETDAYLTSLVSGGNGKAAADLFAKLNASAVAGGRGVGELATKLPGFASALSASGGAIDSTTGKVTGLGSSIEDLAKQTADYATKALAGNASIRGYEAALDLASEAAKRNGKTLKTTTAAGRENSEALDQIASSGLAYAQQILDNGGSEARFQGALKRTRSDLIQAGVKFGLSKTAAQRYATAILGIPKNARTTIEMYGIKNAITSAKNLADRLSRIPRSVTSQVRTEYLDVFASEVEHDKQTARNHHAAGGLIDRSLGGPRQDNVPAWLSAGEFVVNARAVSSPGVEALLRKINASNQMPRFAAGGSVTRASLGLGDLTSSQPARIARIEQARTPAPQVASSGVSRDDLDYFAARIERAMRSQRVVLHDGTIAGAVIREGGRAW